MYRILKFYGKEATYRLFKLAGVCKSDISRNLKKRILEEGYNKDAHCHHQCLIYT